MATSGTISKKIKDWLTLSIIWELNSQSTANNTSSVNVKVTLHAVGGSINSSASKDVKLTVNGTEYKGTCTVGLDNWETKTLIEKNVTIPHDVYGAKTFSMSCELGLNVTLSLSWVGTVSASGSGALPRIPRTSTFTRSGTAKMLSKQTININRYTSSFTHKLKYTWAGETKDIASGIGTSYEWTPLVDMAAKIPNATSGSCVLTLETYSGTTLIGSTSLTFTLSVPDTLVPSVSALTLTEAVDGLAEQFGAFVNTRSKIKFAVTAAGAQGSTIKTYKVSLAGQIFAKASGTTAVITPGAGTKQATVTVMDSRGRTASRSFSYEVIGYTPPAFYEISGHRCDADGVLNEQGECLLLDLEFVATYAEGKNPLSYNIGYKLMDEEEYSPLPFDFTGHAFNDTLLFTEPTFSNNNTYNIRVQLTDYFGTVTKVLMLSSSRPVFDIMYSGSGFAFNKMAEVPDVLDIGYKARFYGGIQSMVLPDGADLNNVMTTGPYTNEDQEAKGFLNCPVSSGTFTLEVLDAGAEGQLLQRLTSTSKETPRVFIRHYYKSEWGPWTAIYDSDPEVKVLWSGGWYMLATHTATLSEPISKQRSGIILEFSYYLDGVAQNSEINRIFVSKHSVKYAPGGMQEFMMATSAGSIGIKRLYISDQAITGHETNSIEFDGTSGLKIFNNKFVLRSVLGV